MEISWIFPETKKTLSSLEISWIFPETKKTLELAGLLSIDEYITNRRETISYYALGTEIYGKCKNSAVLNKSDNTLEWWMVER